MKTEMNNSENYNTESNKDIIKRILSKEESDVKALEKMYKMLCEASAVDDLTMDTDLIDECIKIIELLGGRQEHVPQEKLQQMKQVVKLKYKDSKVKNAEDETSFEKDSAEVEIYEKNGIKHYIFSNIEQIQAICVNVTIEM